MARPIPLVDRSTARTALARVTWIDGYNRHASALGIVGQECAELAERPVRQAIAMSAPGRYPSADIGQFLDRNSALGAFSIHHDSLRDHMVGMFLEPRLFAGEFLEPPFSGFGATPLQGFAASGEPGTYSLDLGTIVNFAVTGGCNVDDSHVNAEPILSLERLGFGNITGASEKPFPAHQTEINLAFAEDQKIALMLSGYEADFHPSFDGPDRNCIIATEPQDTFIVWLCSIGTENGGYFAIDLEGISDLGDGSNRSLCSEIEIGAGRGISQFMQIKLAEDTSRKTLGGKCRAGFVATSQRPLQDGSLCLCRKEFDGGDELHSSNIDWIVQMSNPQSKFNGLPPRRERQGFRQRSR